MKKLRAAVIGVGYLGNFHAQKYAALESVDLIAVSDSDQKRCAEIAANLDCAAVADYRQLVGRVDAVSIVVPTVMHFEVASFFLKHGIHILLEKPVTRTVTEADELIALATAKGTVFQVGHLERFNPALDAVRGEIDTPWLIEARRVAPYKPRGTDVSIVLDLMVHDIDLVTTLIDAEITSITACGAAVYSETADIANARIGFANGSFANLTASRISPVGDRSMQIYQRDTFINLDFQNRKAAITRNGTLNPETSVPEVSIEEISVPARDQILAEIEAFVYAINSGSAPAVTGNDGKRALETALRIEEEIKRNTRLLKGEG
ncbi:MAG: Gfo/Idh/MocA family oxidoreductase [Geobacteraceae bacterium]|nr:Gfo/Idh/MocA family oxidoreductase [Geobacteraceae bacterium]